MCPAISTIATDSPNIYQQIQMGATKCLILQGSRGKKPGKTGFGVELGVIHTNFQQDNTTKTRKKENQKQKEMHPSWNERANRQVSKKK